MSAELWLMLCGTLIAGGAAVVSFVQAKVAVDSKIDAETAQEAAEAARDEALELARKATAAAERHAFAQEEANRLTEKALKVPDWADAYHVSGQVYGIRNSSGSDLEVLEIDVFPEASAHRFRLHDGRKLPSSVQAEDTLRWMRLNMQGPIPTLLIIKYRFDGSNEIHEHRAPLGG